MRREERKINDSKIIDDIIKRSKTCRIALTDGDQPYIVPVNFGFKDNCLYAHSAPVGRKIDIIRKNPKVCFLFDIDEEIVDKGAKACNWSTRYRSVLGFGMAEIIEDEDLKIDGLDIIMNHYSDGDYKYSAKSVAACVIIKIAIDYLSGKSSGY